MGFGVPNRVAGVFDPSVCSWFPNALFCVWDPAGRIANVMRLIV